jgi:tRNA(Arg) A34 adenosine deaminase TadA
LAIGDNSQSHQPGDELGPDSFVATALASAEPYSDTEYFAMALAAAMQAQAAGDYGIAAALVIRSHDTELIGVGRNAVLSSRDPLGHAEVNAIRAVQSALGGQHIGRAQHARPWTGEMPLGSAAGAVFFRPARPGLPARGTESLLYASLEPCPMCTVAIISSRIDRVVVATPDEQGGALAPERFARLPLAWSSLASQQGFVVDFAAGEGAAAPIPAKLAARLSEAFRSTKDARDAEVSQGVLLNGNIEAAIAQLAT